MTAFADISSHRFPARHWHRRDDGRVQCDLCPRACRLAEGQAGFCRMRRAEAGGMVLTAYGLSTGFCIDPIEKKPLYHFLPGAAALSFGTAGCNLACAFCQNWSLSHARDLARLSVSADADAVARAASETGCAAVAFTYNDPAIFLEYAVDVAHACRARGVRPVAVSAGYMQPAARAEFYARMDAVNVDLKAFSEEFYRRLCGARLAPVLETLAYLAHETEVWLEITTLLIPGWNDSQAEIGALVAWIADNLGPGVPLHFSAFHPDGRMLSVPPTPRATLERARRQALDAGLRYVYLGNVADPCGQSTHCPHCGALAIGRDGYRLHHWGIVVDDGGSGARCARCHGAIPGRFSSPPGQWDARRRPLDVAPYARPVAKRRHMT